MKKENPARNAIILYALIAVDIVLSFVLHAALRGMLTPEVEALLPYDQIGNFRFNLIPFRSFVALTAGGYLGVALFRVVVHFVGSLFLGMVLPVLHARFRKPWVTLLVYTAVRLFSSLREIIPLDSGGDIYDVELFLWKLASVFVGWLIWKWLIDGKIDLSQASMD